MPAIPVRSAHGQFRTRPSRAIAMPADVPPGQPAPPEARSRQSQPGRLQRRMRSPARIGHRRQQRAQHPAAPGVMDRRRPERDAPAAAYAHAGSAASARDSCRRTVRAQISARNGSWETTAPPRRRPPANGRFQNSSKPPRAFCRSAAAVVAAGGADVGRRWFDALTTWVLRSSEAAQLPPPPTPPSRPFSVYAHGSSYNPVAHARRSSRRIYISSLLKPHRDGTPPARHVDRRPTVGRILSADVFKNRFFIILTSTNVSSSSRKKGTRLTPIFRLKRFVEKPRRRSASVIVQRRRSISRSAIDTICRADFSPNLKGTVKFQNVRP